MDKIRISNISGENKNNKILGIRKHIENDRKSVHNHIQGCQIT